MPLASRCHHDVMSATKSNHARDILGRAGPQYRHRQSAHDRAGVGGERLEHRRRLHDLAVEARRAIEGVAMMRVSGAHPCSRQRIETGDRDRPRDAAEKSTSAHHAPSSSHLPTQRAV
jgi:hypothetical protein